MDFKNKKVFITGAANGIGKCLAIEFAKKEATLILVDRSGIDLKTLERKLIKDYPGIALYPYVCDITDKNGLDMLINKIIYWEADKLGVPDIVINNAGIGITEPIQDVELSMWKLIFNVNFFAPVEISQRLTAALRAYNALHTSNPKRMRIVNVSSGQAFFKLPTWSAYAVSKIALAAFSEAWGIEAKKVGVDVTTVYPFMVNTGFYDGVEEKSSTLAGKLSMKLLPYYSNKPETVAKKIVKACKNKKRVEMVNPVNLIGYYLDTIPTLGRVVRQLADKFLS